MIKVIPICPEHQEELRQEFLTDDEGRGYMSGFCFKCAKHYPLCTRVRYMNHCVRQRGHEGEHLDSEHHTWNGEFNKHG